MCSWCTVVFSCLTMFPAVLGMTCLSMLNLYEIECGSFTHPNCKFSAKYLTIKPDGIDSGFGDAYFDTNDIDIELRCSFRTPEAGKMTVAIISFEDNYENALAEFHKKIKNGRGKVEILAENQGLIEKDAVIKTNATLLSIDRTPNKTYTCLCPHVIYKYVTEKQLKYLSASKVHPSNFSRSSSFYTVPLYEPCKVETCSDINNEQMDYCYETKTGPSLGEMNLKEIHKLVNYCENRGIKKNWVTEDWTEEWKERMVNVLKLDNVMNGKNKKLHHLASKAIAEHFFSGKNSLEGWISSYHFVGVWHEYSLISEYMLNKPSFPWFNPEEDEIGSLLLPGAYKYKQNGITSGKEIKCREHIELLKGLKSKGSKTKIPKFYAKTYPTCIDNFVGENNRDVDYNFELFFNDKNAFYDSKHFSVEEGNNNLTLKIMPSKENLNINERREFKYEAIDCSLYSWNRSKGIQTYNRTKLESNNFTLSEKNEEWGIKSILVFEFNISSSLIFDYNGDYKILVGCYIKYTYFCGNQTCDNITRLKKMQFYVQTTPSLELMPEYSPVTKRLTKCKHADKRFVWKSTDDGNEICECVSQIFLCNPLKTSHQINKSFPCVRPTFTESPGAKKSGSGSPKPEKDNTTLFVILSVIGVLLFITGIAVAMFFNSKKKNNQEVRVLTIIEQAPETNSAKDENKYFDTEIIQTSSDLTSTDKKCDANETTSQTTNNIA